MAINRYNYEEYFLLYVDDELSPQEQQEVKDFIAQQADLAEELLMLQQTKLFSEPHIRFNHKERLFKNVQRAITPDNYEEYFLLYIDAELNERDKKEVEDFLAQNPQMKAAFDVLRQTKLQPENISCPNKELLYKKAETDTPVRPMIWKKIAIAATLTGLIALLWWLVPAEKQSQLALQTPVEINKAPKNEAPDAAIENPVIAEKAPQAEQKTIVKHNENKSSESHKNAIATVKKPVTTKAELAKIIMPAEKQINKIKEAEIKAPALVREINNEDKLTAIPKKLIPLEEITSEKTKTTEASYAAATNKNTITQPAVYKELNTNEDDDKTLYVGSLQLNKEKVKGFLKKTSRLLGAKARETGADDGQLEVANLRFDTNKLK